MFLLLKIGCLGVYGLALAGWAGLLEGELSARMQGLAAVLLVLHGLELVVMFKHVRKYPGRLLVSVLLTLLFGLLHWKPLSKVQAGRQT